MRYSLHISSPKTEAYNCETCDKQDARNCNNRKGMRHDILFSDDWREVTPKLRHSLKTAKTKFFECPLTAITAKTWRILGIVNDTTTEDGEILANLPPEVSHLPQWYLDDTQKFFDWLGGRVGPKATSSQAKIKLDS